MMTPKLRSARNFLLTLHKKSPLSIVILFIILGSLALTAYPSANGDNVSYIVLAESLVKGLGYVNTIHPGDVAETQYPPLLPILLSPLVGLLGRNYFALKLIPLAFGAGALAMIFKLFHEHVGSERAFIVTLLTGLNAWYLNLATSIVAEPVYLFFSAAALLYMNRFITTGQNFNTLVTTALLLAASFYTRTVGISLVVASLIFLLLRRRLKSAFILCILLAVLLGWWGWRSSQLGNPYVQQLMENSTGVESTKKHNLWMSRVLHNAPRYAGKVMSNLVGGPAIARLNPYQPVKVFSSLFISALFLLGFLIDLRRGITLEGLYLLIYLGIYAVWPYHDARFLVPVLPFIFLHVLRGTEALATPWPSRQHWARTAMVVLLTVVGLTGCSILIHHNRTQYYYPEMARYREACSWIESNTSSDAVLLCRKPRLAAIWSGRKTWWYAGKGGPAELVKLNRLFAATHLIINDFSISGVNLADRFAPILHSYPQDFSLLFQTDAPIVSVYEIHP
jgi:hypothetical protein